MLTKLPRWPRLEVEVGCLAPLALVLAIAIAVGVAVGTRLSGASEPAPQVVNVRVIDDGARSGPKVIATAVVPLR